MAFRASDRNGWARRWVSPSGMRMAPGKIPIKRIILYGASSVSERPERGGHDSARLACGVVARSDLAARLIEPDLHFIGQFKLLFQIVLEPCAQLYEFRP